MNKNYVILILILVILILSFGIYKLYKPSNTPSTKDSYEVSLDNYYSGIDYSCNTDSDCEIKNVGNCCGYYPNCVNKDANIDTNVLKDICDNFPGGSVCGFPRITSCECVQNKCKSKS